MGRKIVRLPSVTRLERLCIKKGIKLDGLYRIDEKGKKDEYVADIVTKPQRRLFGKSINDLIEQVDAI